MAFFDAIAGAARPDWWLPGKTSYRQLRQQAIACFSFL